jgi:negative regulator of flagellin synthesis FlgM
VTNRINGYDNAQLLQSPKGAGNGVQSVDKSQTDAAGATASSAAPSSSADQLTLTSSARTLQKLSAAVAQTPVVNSDKVAAVKQSIQNGTYTINAGSIADKMLQTESELN